MSVSIRQRIERILEFVEESERLFAKREKTLREMLKKLRKEVAELSKAKDK